MPTILDLFAAEAPPGQTAPSLLPLIRGEERSAAAPGPVYSEAWMTPPGAPSGEIERFRPPSVSVRVGSRKATRIRGPHGFRYEYYDLSEDPGEQRDLYPSRPQEASDLIALLDRYEEEKKERSRELLGEEEPPAASLQLDPEHEEKLRALGYVIEAEPSEAPEPESAPSQ